MAYTFDGPNKTIILSSGTTDFSVTDMWSRWVDWILISDNSKYLPAMRFVGGDPISATKNLGITYFITNDWKIRPYEANHRLTVNGNLFTDPAGSSPFTNTIGNFNVTIEMAVSNLSDSTVAQMNQINAAVYRGQVAVDPVLGGIGTTFPKGTHESPVNNWADAVNISNAYGIETLILHGSGLLTTGDNISGKRVVGENAITTMLTIDSAAVVTNCQFEDLFLSNSSMDGYTYLKHCAVSNVSAFEGYMEGCMITSAINLTTSGPNPTYFVDCKSGCIGLGASDLPVLSMAGTSRHVAFRNFAGPIKIKDSTDASNTICLDITSGATVTLDATCTAGTAYIRGICQVVNNSTMTVHLESQLDNTSISSAVGNRVVEATYTADEVMRLMASVLSGKVSGAGSGSEVFRDLSDTKNRLTVTTDASGNRTAVVRDAT